MQKKIPMRTCIGCGTIKPKKELVRIVVTQEGKAAVDRTGRAGGRGAYLCDDPACLEKALKRKSFARAFHMQIGPDDCDRLKAEMGGENAG